MSAAALAIESAIVAALSLPTPVAARVARGDVKELPNGVADGVIVRVSGLDSYDPSVDEDSAMAVWSVELELQRLGPIDQSAAQALQSLLSLAHGRLMADRTLGDTAQRITLADSDGIRFETTSGGELPAHSATLRYQAYSNLNPLTLGA